MQEEHMRQVPPPIVAAPPAHNTSLTHQEYVESMDLGETELTELIESVPALLTHSNPKVINNNTTTTTTTTTTRW